MSHKHLSILEHLQSRHLDSRRYNVKIEEDRAFFLLYNLSGQIVGYQQYIPHAPKTRNNDPRVGRYFTRIANNAIAVWGTESLQFKGPLFLTEGIFDACRLHRYNLAAIAVLGNNPEKLRGWLYATSRHIVSFCDNDTAGKALSSYGHKHIVGNTDIGDMTTEELEKHISPYL